MTINIVLNGSPVSLEVRPDEMLMEALRARGCYSIKCGCETTNCGLCTVLVDGRPMLSCAYPAPRAEGRNVVTLEGLQDEAQAFASFVADQGADQCGFCNPGFVMNVLAMERELKWAEGGALPSDQEIQHYLAGNLCRCTGFAGQLRAIKDYYAKTYGATADQPAAGQVAEVQPAAAQPEGEVATK